MDWGSRDRPVPTTSTIIVVEDDPIVRDIAAEAFREAGYVVVEFGSADEALVLIEASPSRFAALVTDVQMPGTCDGLELAAAAAGRWPGMPVLVTSGGLRLGGRAVPAGAVFVPKPWQPSALVDRVQDLVARRTL